MAGDGGNFLFGASGFCKAASRCLTRDGRHIACEYAGAESRGSQNTERQGGYPWLASHFRLRSWHIFPGKRRFDELVRDGRMSAFPRRCPITVTFVTNSSGNKP